MINSFLILLGKFISLLSRLANRGNGSTWPGHIALSINKNFIKDILAANDQRLATILVVGTNGKTTTSKLIQAILEQDKKRVFQNASGANLLNGIASTLLLKSNLSGKLPYDFAIFEIDENTLPLVLKELTPHYIVALNLFRDQLDRYGEVNTIATKWHTTMEHLPNTTTLILNADDPQIAYLGKDPSSRHSGNPPAGGASRISHLNYSDSFCKSLLCKSFLPVWKVIILSKSLKGWVS